MDRQDDNKTNQRIEHPIITGEHACNDRIPAERLQAYHQERPVVSLKPEHPITHRCRNGS